VYDKSSKFSLLKTKEGYRHYLRFCFAELLPPKSNIFKNSIAFLKVLDSVLNFILDFRFKFLNNKKRNLYNVEKIIKWDDEIDLFLKEFKNKELFKRDKELFNWIKEYPWIKTDTITEKLSKDYYFSYFAYKFDSQWYKVYDKSSQQIIAVFLINIKDGHLKVPYAYYTNDSSSEIIKNELLNICKNGGINYVTLYDRELNTVFLSHRLVTLKSKKFIQNYFVTEKLLNEFPELKTRETQSGDGDVVFT
jgi:hypothetical protein